MLFIYSFGAVVTYENEYFVVLSFRKRYLKVLNNLGEIVYLKESEVGYYKHLPVVFHEGKQYCYDKSYRIISSEGFTILGSNPELEDLVSASFKLKSENPGFAMSSKNLKIESKIFTPDSDALQERENELLDAMLNARLNSIHEAQYAYH